MINIEYIGDSIFHIDNETKTISIPMDWFRTGFVMGTEIEIHTEQILKVLEKRLICNQGKTEYIPIYHTFTIDKGKIRHEDHFTLSNYTAPFWEHGMKILLEFDQHPNNINDHERLSDREPLYHSDQIFVTKSGILLVYTTNGWQFEELITKDDISLTVVEELTMVRNFMKVAFIYH